MQRAGNRRYYRPADVDLARRINRLLNEEGYTVRGVQKLLRDRNPQGGVPIPPREPAQPPPPVTTEAAQPTEGTGLDVFQLIHLRNRLAEALDD